MHSDSNSDLQSRQPSAHFLQVKVSNSEKYGLGQYS